MHSEGFVGRFCARSSVHSCRGPVGRWWHVFPGNMIIAKAKQLFSGSRQASGATESTCVIWTGEQYSRVRGREARGNQVVVLVQRPPHIFNECLTRPETSSFVWQSVFLYHSPSLIISIKWNDMQMHIPYLHCGPIHFCWQFHRTAKHLGFKVLETPLLVASPT